MDKNQHIYTLLESGHYKEGLDQLEITDPQAYTVFQKGLVERLLELKETGEQYPPEIMQLIEKAEQRMEAYKCKMN